jgi:hypothetical protein
MSCLWYVKSYCRLCDLFFGVGRDFVYILRDGNRFWIGVVHNSKSKNPIGLDVETQVAKVA